MEQFASQFDENETSHRFRRKASRFAFGRSHECEIRAAKMQNTSRSDPDKLAFKPKSKSFCQIQRSRSGSGSDPTRAPIDSERRSKCAPLARTMADSVDSAALGPVRASYYLLQFPHKQTVEAAAADISHHGHISELFALRASPYEPALSLSLRPAARQKLKERAPTI